MKSLVAKCPRSKLFNVLMTVLLLSNFTGQTMGQVCTSTFVGSVLQLMPCRSAVAAFGAELPSESCCTALKVLGQPCLCMLINGPPIAGLDRSLAMQLPAKCAANFDPCK
jgi:Probable lipid transfer